MYLGDELPEKIDNTEDGQGKKVQVELDNYLDRQQQNLMSKEVHKRQEGLDRTCPPILENLSQFLR